MFYKFKVTRFILLVFINKFCLLKTSTISKSNYIKKEALALVFSCEFWEMSKNTFFTQHLWTTSSEHIFFYHYLKKLRES